MVRSADYRKTQARRIRKMGPLGVPQSRFFVLFRKKIALITYRVVTRGCEKSSSKKKWIAAPFCAAIRENLFSISRVPANFYSSFA